MMSGDRRIRSLEIAAKMFRPRSGEDRIPTAKELCEYADELEGFVYDRKVPKTHQVVDLGAPPESGT